MSEASFDPYYKWLGIPREEQPPHYYRLLGISAFEADSDVIETAADQRMSHVRTFQAGKHGEFSQKLLNELAAAKLTLLQPAKKSAYDESLRAKISRDQQAKAPAKTATRSLPKAQSLQERPPQIAIAAPTPVQHPSTSPAVAQAKPGFHPVVIAGVGAIAAIVLLAIGFLAVRMLIAPGETTVAERDPTSTNDTTANDNASSSNETPKPVVPAPPVIPPKTEPVDVRPVDPPPKEPIELAPEPPITTPEPRDEPAPEPEPTPTESPLEPEPVEPVEEIEPALPAPPSAAKVAAAIQEIKTLFKQEYAATRPEDRQALAKKLLEQATDTNGDPVAHVGLLQESQRLAVAVADFETASAAIDALAASYSVEPFALKAESLQSIAKLARLPAQHEAIADTCVALIDGAAEAEQYDAAKTLALVASVAARKARKLEVVKQIEQRSKAIEAERKAHSALQAARDALASDPDDPEANLAYGKFLCLAQGEWDRGLSHLTRGNDKTLQDLATRDIAQRAAGASANAEEQVKLADAWYDYGDTELPFRGRAAYWYDAVLPTLTGLPKVRVEKRLDEIAEAKLDGGLGLGSLAASAVVLLTFEKSTVVPGNDFAFQDLSPKQAVFKGKAKLVPGVAGTAAYFSGLNDSIGGGRDIPHANAPRSYSLWMKTDGVRDVRYSFNGGTADGGKFLMFVFCNRGGNYSIDLYNYSVGTKVTLDTQWHHHCAVYNGADLVYLIDGVVVGAEHYDLATSPSGVSFGGSPVTMDEIAIFDRALTDKEVLRLYQMGKSRRVLKQVEQPSP